MKKVSFMLLAMWMATLMMICSVVSGCRTPAPVTLAQKDSVRIEVRTQRIIIHDTFYINVPEQSAERTTMDDSSHLETDFAESTAKVNPDGTLSHKLWNKDGKKPVETDKEIVYRDSLVYIDKEVEVPVPVEKELTLWQQFCIKWMPYAIILILLAGIYILRKPFLSLLRKII